VPKNGAVLSSSEFNTEREIMYKILFDMRNDINDLKSLTSELIKNKGNGSFNHQENELISRVYPQNNEVQQNSLLYFENENSSKEGSQLGDFVQVMVHGSTRGTLLGEMV
jgi:site-specific DNA-adenine methylase